MKNYPVTTFLVSLALLVVLAIAYKTPAQNPSALVPYSCTITLSTDTTTQCQPVPGQGLRNYVQGYQIVTTTAGTGTTITFEYGTGTSCGTGTTAFTAAYPDTTAVPANSAGTLVSLSGSGITVPWNNAVCAVQAGTTAGTAYITVWGYIGQ